MNATTTAGTAILDQLEKFNSEFKIQKKFFIRDSETGYYHFRLGATTQFVVINLRPRWEISLEFHNSETGKWEVAPSDTWKTQTYDTLHYCIHDLEREAISRTRQLKKLEIEAYTTTAERDANAHDFKLFIPRALLVGVDFSEAKYFKTRTQHTEKNEKNVRIDFKITINEMEVSGRFTRRTQYNDKCTTDYSLNLLIQPEHFWTDAATVRSYEAYGDPTRVEISHGSGGHRDADTVTIMKERIEALELAIQITEKFAAHTGATIK